MSAKKLRRVKSKLSRSLTSRLRKWGRLNYEKQEAMSDQRFEDAVEILKRARGLGDQLLQELLEETP